MRSENPQEFNMPVAGKPTDFTRQPRSSPSRRSKPSKYHHNSNSSNAAEDPFPSIRTLILQSSLLGLALILLYVRKSEMVVLGCQLRLVWGRVPAECLLLSLLIGEMATREFAKLGPEIFGWVINLY